MSPVNEEPVPIEPDPRVTRFITRTTSAVGATDRVPLRVMLLFVLAAMCVAVAPVPANLIGVAAIALLALDTALHRR